MDNIEKRKLEEKEYHDFLRNKALEAKSTDFNYYTSNRKWYSIIRNSIVMAEMWLSRESQDKRVLDYCCGNGGMAIKVAKMGVNEIIGVDISDISIENAKKEALKEKVDEKTIFSVMDAENLQFKDNYFDIAYEFGVLHHLDLKKAYSELARVLKPEGKCLCVEGLGHNPIIQYYRRKTPHLRTEYEIEHILHKKDIELAKEYFERVEIVGFFHLATLVAVPFRKLQIFDVFLNALEAVDTFLLKLPILKWQAWQVVFVVCRPKKK